MFTVSHSGSIFIFIGAIFELNFLRLMYVQWIKFVSLGALTLKLGLK